MSLKKTLLKNTTLNMAGYLYLLIAAMFSIPILIKNLGSSQYGIFILFGSFAPLLSAFDLGLSQASIRFLSLPDLSLDKRKKIWTTALSGFFVLSLAVTLTAMLLISFGVSKMAAVSDLSPFSFWIMTALTCAIVFFNHLNVGMLTLPQADQRFDVYNKRVLIIGTTNTLGIALVSYYFQSPIFLFLTQLSSQIIMFLSLFSYIKKSLPGINPQFGFDQEYRPKLFNFGYKQFIGNVSSQINFYISRFIIGSSLPAQSVTSFGVPQNLIAKAAGGISQMTLALFPMGTALSTKERLPKLKRLVWGLELLIFLLGLSGIIFIHQLGLPVLQWWLKNPELAQNAYSILKILSWYFAIAILTPIPTAMSESLNYPQVPSFFAVLTTITTIILLLVFIPTYGIVGAAYAYLASAILTAPPFIIAFAYLLNHYGDERRG